MGDQEESTEGGDGDPQPVVLPSLFPPRLVDVGDFLVSDRILHRFILSETRLVLRHARPGPVVLTLAVFYLIYPVRAMRWRVLLTNVGFTRRAGYAMPSLLSLIRLLIIVAFANTVTVDQLGDTYRAFILKQEARVSFPVTLGTTLAERIIDLIVLVAMLGVATLIAFAGLLPTQAVDLLVVGTVLAVLGIAFLVLLRRLGPFVIRGIPSRWHDGYRRSPG